VVHAECSGLTGEQAFYHCLAFDGGSFSSLPWSDPEVNSIKRRGDFLLLDAAREKDETTQVTEPPRRPSYVEEAMIDFDLHDTDNEERT
jgi:hypothetical protein